MEPHQLGGIEPQPLPVGAVREGDLLLAVDVGDQRRHVVRDGAQAHLALGLAQLRLLQRGDVEGHDVEAQDPPLQVLVRDQVDLEVAGPCRAAAPATGKRAASPASTLGRKGSVLRVHRLAHRGAQGHAVERAVAQAGHLPRPAVAVEAVLLAIEIPHQGRDAVGDVAQPLLLLAQGLADVDLVGDVEGHGEHALHHADVVLVGDVVGLVGPIADAEHRIAGLLEDHRLPRERAPVVGLDDREVLRAALLGHRLADHRLVAGAAP